MKDIGMPGHLQLRRKLQSIFHKTSDIVKIVTLDIVNPTDAALYSELVSEERYKVIEEMPPAKVGKALIVVIKYIDKGPECSPTRAKRSKISKKASKKSLRVSSQ